MVHELFDLTGRVALITGGSKGIGKSIARGFAQAGANVAISARHEDELQRAAAEIGEGLDSRVEYFRADMVDRSQIADLAENVLGRLGQVDILVNNAGSNEPQALVDITDEVWDRIVQLNLTSCMQLSRALAPQMIERRWGRIIYVSSIMGLSSGPARSSYSGTKAALIGISQAQALELGPSGITVNCICPGPILTDLPRSVLSDQQMQAWTERTALQRWGDPVDMIGPALLLASQAGAYVSGTYIVADGGLLARALPQ